MAKLPRPDCPVPPSLASVFSGTLQEHRLGLFSTTGYGSPATGDQPEIQSETLVDQST